MKSYIHMVEGCLWNFTISFWAEPTAPTSVYVCMSAMYQYGNTSYSHLGALLNSSLHMVVIFAPFGFLCDMLMNGMFKLFCSKLFVQRHVTNTLDVMYAFAFQMGGVSTGQWFHRDPVAVPPLKTDRTLPTTPSPPQKPVRLNSLCRSSY